MPWWVWSAILTIAVFVPGLYLIVAELWYMTVFLQTKERAPEHYSASKTRYFTAAASVLILYASDHVAELMYSQGILELPANVYSIGRTILLFVFLLMAVWQLVILLNAYTYAIEGENFKNSRAKYLLVFIFAPIGAWYIDRSETERL